MKTAILGAGAWGTAMAVHLGRLGYLVTLYVRSEEKAKALEKNRENTFYLPSVRFPNNLIISNNLKACFESDFIFIATPLKGIRELCRQIHSHAYQKVKLFISLCKGLESESFLFPSQLLREELGEGPYASLSGPTYALELAQGKPCAMVLGSKAPTARVLPKLLSNDALRVYRTTDIMGVELAGCLKNVYAIGAGIIDGLGLGDNAKAAYLTRALKEMCRLGRLWGAKRQTLYGLSGLGDLLLTANGKWSRNRSFGERFAKGIKIADLIKTMTVEGYGNLEGFYRRIKQQSIDAPLLNALHAAIYKEGCFKSVISELMQRKLKME